MTQVQAVNPNRNLLSHNSAAGESASSGPSDFMKGLSDTVSFVGSVAYKGAQIAVGRSAPGAAGLLGGLGGGGVGGLGGGGAGGGDLGNLLQLQLEVQERMQRFTMLTNIAKTEHESRMSAVRNMRA